MTKRELLKELEKFSDDAEIVYKKSTYEGWDVYYDTLELDSLRPEYKDGRTLTKFIEYDNFLTGADYIVMEFY